jgi:hypothetical protein
MFAVEIGMLLKWKCECETESDLSEARFRAATSHFMRIIWIAFA